MNFIQFDKNTGDKRLRAVCLEEGIVDCELLPRRLRDETDDVVLEYVIQNRFVIFTFDREIHNEWGAVLAGRNPGIIILRQDEDVLRQINTKTAPRHLRGFKESFPAWHTVPCRNSVLELTPTRVFVYHTLAPIPELTYWANWREAGWEPKLIAHLEANASGKPL